VPHCEGVSDPGLFVTQSVDFGNAPQNDDILEEVIPISNSGSNNTLTITGVSSSGTNPDNFAITDFPDSLTPGETGEITIAFDRKGRVGDFAANVILETNDPDAIDQAAMITVIATVPAGGDADEDGLPDAQDGLYPAINQ
jgi:hypothetical protein